MQGMTLHVRAGGAANVLQYSGGYANVTAAAFHVVPHTQTWEQCAARCSAAAACVAWTRVAGACFRHPLTPTLLQGYTGSSSHGACAAGSLGWHERPRCLC